MYEIGIALSTMVMGRWTFDPQSAVDAGS